MCVSACFKLNLTSTTNGEINLAAQHVTRTYHLFSIALDDDVDGYNDDCTREDGERGEEVKWREFKP